MLISSPYIIATKSSRKTGLTRYDVTYLFYHFRFVIFFFSSHHRRHFYHYIVARTNTVRWRGRTKIIKWNAFKVELILWIIVTWIISCSGSLCVYCKIPTFLPAGLAVIQHTQVLLISIEWKPEIAWSNWSTNLLHNDCTSNDVTVDSRTFITSVCARCR